MPTTRSRGRNEPLQRLETPPKRQRKQRPRCCLYSPGVPHGSRIYTHPTLPSPEQNRRFIAQEHVGTQTFPFPYADAFTQTDNVIILTELDAADPRDQTNTLPTQKRNRDDESEDEPTAKRQQFSTPQTKSTNLWMFGEKLNGDHPRTAPSKSLATSSLRRPARGPLSKRSHIVGSPLRRPTPSSKTRQSVVPNSIRPIEQGISPLRDETPTDGATTQTQVQQQQQQAPETPRGGLFGSLRGMVNKGWGFAASFSPVSVRTESRAPNQSVSNLGQIPHPHLQPAREDRESSTDSTYGGTYRGPDARNPSVHTQEEQSYPVPTASEPARRTSRYDHLHYVHADSNSISKATNGDLEDQPRASTPPSPTSRLRAKNPQLSDATIESIVKKRERKTAMNGERFGSPDKEEVAKAAPLFGPDSHYSRGTVDPRFLPLPAVYGSTKKRKLESVGGQIPRPKNGGFGIDEEYLDTEVEVDNVDMHPFADQEDPFASPSKKQKISEPVPVTPRSALKKPGAMSSIGRKSVTFGNSMSRDIRSHYGPAGQYKGSTFADDSPADSSTLSSIDVNDVISPTTQLNTFTNSGKRPSVRDNLGANIPAIDFTLRDPNDDTWRPSLVNPRPGSFRVPDVDEEDPDESMIDAPPEQPQTPRLSHAELPNSSKGSASASAAASNESTNAHESTTELALDKARSKAEKYKPKSSSRLSNVAQARSRSPSPDGDADIDTEDEAITPRMKKSPFKSTASPVRALGAPRQPFVAKQLDDITQGPDGMTDHEREHQYDQWAANLHWDAPQTYEDAGTGSIFVHNLIRKNWTDEDSKRSETFWSREFDEVDLAMKEAQSQGMQLVLVTGFEDV